MSKIELRSYQQDVNQSIVKTYKRGISRQLVVMATGTGKSLTLVNQILKFINEGKRTLILVDQEDLVWQWKDYVHMMDGSVRVGIEKAEYKASMQDQVVVATVQTLGRKGIKRIKRFKPDHFDLCVADEADKSIADTWFRTLNYFGFGHKNFTKGNLLVGCTATPYRADGASLGTLYDDVVANYDTAYAIGEGWLTDISLYDVKTNTDLSAGKYSRQGEVDKAVDNPERNAQALKAFKDICQGKQTLIYCASVDHAYSLQKLFEQEGIKGAVIEANTDKADRKEYLQNYKDKDLQVLFNYGTLCLDEKTEILTDEGWCGIDEMTYSKNVANWDNGKIWFDKPKFIIRRDRKEGERMFTVPNSYTDIRVTEHHEMLWSSQYNLNSGGKFKKSYVSDISDKMGIMLPVTGQSKPKKFDFKIDRSLTKKQYKRKITANSYKLRKVDGLGWKESKTVAKKNLDENLSLQIKNPDELSLKECQFLGFFLADGSLYDYNDGGQNLSFSQSKKYKNIIEWFDKLCKDLCLDVRRYEKENKWNGYVTWELGRGTGFGSQKVNGWYRYTPYLNKNTFEWMWGLNRDQFISLLKGYWLGDGNHGLFENGFPTTFRIGNTNKPLLDALQTVSICRDIKATIGAEKIRKEEHKNLWTITFDTTQKYHYLGERKFTEEQDWKPERVWCITTDSTNIITRRNGKVVVTGNTRGTDLPDTKNLMLLRPVKSKNLLQQIIGRGIRPSPTAHIDIWNSREERLNALSLSTKPYCKIIDLYDKVGKHNFAHVPSLFGLNNELKAPKQKQFFKEVVEPIEKVKKEHGIDPKQIKSLDDIDLVVKNRKLEIKSLELSPEVSNFTDRTWMELGNDSYEIVYSENNKALIIEKDQSKAELIDKDQWNLLEYDSKDGITKNLQTFNSLGGAFKIADQYADQQGFANTFNKKAEWQKHGVTQGQLNMLNRMFKYKTGYAKFDLLKERYEDTGIRKVYWKPTGEVLSKGTASKLISEKINK